jgi:hypothetical protein
MPRKLMLALLLPLSAAWLQAQPANPSSDKNKPSEPVTIQGCLQDSENKFILIESDGTTHVLSGSGGKLKHELGHEVELTGKNETETLDDTSPGGASSVKMITVFQVKTIKHVDDTCKTY